MWHIGLLYNCDFLIKCFRIFFGSYLTQAGKTTLLNSICDFIHPTSGRICFKGKEIQQEKSLLKGFGILIEPRFFDYLTAEENLKYLMRLSVSNDTKGIIEELLRKTDLYESRSKKVKGFSFGMKQRLGLCQSLLTKVDILILDEPFVGLDPIGKELFKKIIIDMAKEKNTPVLFSSHDLDDVDEICDRVVMIQEGKKTLDQKITRVKTITLQIDGIISTELKEKLQGKRRNITVEKSQVRFQEKEDMVDIQKALLEDGHYIIGVSIQSNNLKGLFFKEGQA